MSCDGHHISLWYLFRHAQDMRTSRQLTYAVYGVIDFLQSHPFYIFISNLFAKEMHLIKYMEVAYASGPLTAVMTASSTLYCQHPMRISESLDQLRLRDEHSANSEIEKKTLSATSKA